MGWGEMAEGEKLIGGRGSRVSNYLRTILEKKRRWLGGGFQ